jgi:hypothetical protein
MNCGQAGPHIEALAAGEPVDRAVEAHVSACTACTGALALARQLDALLLSRAAPAAPPRFLTQVQSGIRRDRWRQDQYVDVGFNLTVAAGILLAAAGFWLLLNISGLTSVGGDVAAILAAGLDVAGQRIGSALPTYVGAAALLATTVAIWWWAEGAF